MTLKKLNDNQKLVFDNKTLVLASSSMSRFKIMKKARIKFEAIPASVDEEKLKSEFGKVYTEDKAIEYVKFLSYEKAKWLSERTKNAVILAADTIAFCENEILEKPKDEEDARRIFNKLSNSIHVAITGVCIIDDENIISFAKVSPVKMLEISNELQDALVRDELTYTYAGGYCVDGKLGDKAIVAKEDFDNVMGLPISDVKRELEEVGYDFSE